MATQKMPNSSCVDRGRRRVGQRLARRVDARAGARRVYAVGQQNHDQLAPRVDDQRGARESSVSVGLRTCQLAHVVVGVELPAKAAPVDTLDLVACHLGYRLGLQQSRALQLAAIEIQLGEPADVLRGTE